MHFKALASIILLTSVPVVTADYMWVSKYCYIGCTYAATYYTNFGSYIIQAREGCQGGTGVPGMVEMCMDWPRSRGHVRFSHQNFKRCLVVTHWDTDCDAGDVAYCQNVKYEEVGCSWREANDSTEEDTPAIESAPADITAAATPTETAERVPSFTTSIFNA